MPNSEPLVTVIIPCYNQAHFLGEAIESVLAQNYRPVEIIVIDDGSPDNTAEVSARYEGVRYFRQENQGESSARNNGIRQSRGSYLVFLDADDRLLPDALEIGVKCLNAHPECALVFGRCRFIAGDSSPIPGIQKRYNEDDHYAAMLNYCPIPHPAEVMCRRLIFDSGVTFDASLSNCADYAFYLRVARDWPIYCHNQVVSEYRRHASNKSGDARKMLVCTVSALRLQWAHVKGDKQYEEAYRRGIRGAQYYWGHKLAVRVSADLRGQRRWPRLAVDALTLLRHYWKVRVMNQVLKLARRGDHNSEKSDRLI